MKRLLLISIVLSLLLTLTVITAAPALACNPNTAVGISASELQVLPETEVTLTITEANTGDEDLKDVWVYLEPLGLTLDNSSNPLYTFSGDDGDGVLDVGETWQWLVPVTVSGDTTYAATGHGWSSGLGKDITPANGYTSEYAEVTVTVTEDGNGNAQLTPTGNECCDFLAGTAEDLVLTANPKSGNINPGRFFYYTMFEATGDTNIEVITYSDPDPAPDPTAEGVKVFIVQNGRCKHVSRHATITKTDNVVNIFVPAEIVAQSEDGTLIFRVEYKPPKYYGVETTFHFETYLLNGSPQMVASESITTVEKQF